MFLSCGLRQGAWLLLLGCALINSYAGGPGDIVLRLPAFQLEIREVMPHRPLLEDDVDRRVYQQTVGVFNRVADRMIIGEYETARQQGAALGLLLQMVVNNWTDFALLDVAERAFARIFREASVFPSAYHLLMDSIVEEYGDGTSNADRLMRWLLASLCCWKTPIPYPEVRANAYLLLLSTDLVPRGFISVFDRQEDRKQEDYYRQELARRIESIQLKMRWLQDGRFVNEEQQLRALNSIFDLATDNPVVAEDMALIETVATGYDRLFRDVDFEEKVLLAFIQRLGGMKDSTLEVRNLIGCVLVLLCEKETQVPYLAVRKKAYDALKVRNQVPGAFIVADLD